MTEITIKRSNGDVKQHVLRERDNTEGIVEVVVYYE